MSEIFNLQTLCRCCHKDGSFKSLQLAYVYKNCVEVYSTMLQETFDISIIPPQFEASFSICDDCIQQLRDGLQFKQRVLICEQKFEEYCKNEQALVKEEFESDDDKSLVDRDYDESMYENDCKAETTKEWTNFAADEKCNIEIKEDKDSKNIEIEIDSKENLKKTAKLKSLPKVKDKTKTKKIENATKLDPELEIRLSTEHGVSFICKICGKKYNTIKKLRKHTPEVHKETIRCSYCSKQCITKLKYLAHVRMHTRNRQKCKICEKMFSSKYSLSEHMNTHTKSDLYQCDICQKAFKYRQSIRKHILWHSGANKKCVCDVCGKSFNDRTNMNIHIQTVHLKMRPFKCTVCPKTFTANKHLKEHFKTHTDEKPNYCGICYKSFSCSWSLKQHNIQKHEDLNEFRKNTCTCKICKEVFETRGKLLSHMRCHIGEKKYKCHICTKDFVSKYTLNRHVDGHSGIKAYNCFICNIRFSQQTQLNRHNYRFHDPNRVIKEKVKCDLCNKFYRDRDKHMDSHNKRPHSCEWCSKCYPERNALNRHIKYAHLGVKPFVCTVCDKKYTKMFNLKKHTLKVHKMVLKKEKD